MRFRQCPVESIAALVAGNQQDIVDRFLYERLGNASFCLESDEIVGVFVLRSFSQQF